MGTKRIFQQEPSHAVHRDTILFEKKNDLYWLRDRHLNRAKKVLGFSCDERSIGFDGEMAIYYMQALLEEGERVAVIKDNSIHSLVLQGSGNPSKVQSTTIGISPELLVGQKDLMKLVNSKEAKRPPTQELIATLKEYLLTNNTKELSGYGTLYVYQFQDMYEPDWELTTMPESVIPALLVAANLARRMIKCQLVEPKGRRRNRKGHNTRKEKLMVSQYTAYGQLSLEL